MVVRKNLDTRKQQTAHANTREAVTLTLAYHLKISHVFRRKVGITLRDFTLKSGAKLRLLFGMAKFIFKRQMNGNEKSERNAVFCASAIWGIVCNFAFWKWTTIISTTH